MKELFEGEFKINNNKYYYHAYPDFHSSDDGLTIDDLEYKVFDNDGIEIHLIESDAKIAVDKIVDQILDEYR